MTVLISFEDSKSAGECFLVRKMPKKVHMGIEAIGKNSEEN